MGMILPFICKDCKCHFEYTVGTGMLGWDDYRKEKKKAALDGKYGELVKEYAENNKISVTPHLYVCHNCRTQIVFPFDGVPCICPECGKPMVVYKYDSYIRHSLEVPQIYCPKCKSPNVDSCPSILFD